MGFHYLSLGALLASFTVVVAISPQAPPYDWKSLEPSREIKWQSCYNNEVQCARLILPMDWLSVEPELGDTSELLHRTDDEEKKNRTVTVAIIKLPAVVPDSDPSFAGPIFTNPGGPGNSGIEFLHRMGRNLQRSADQPGRRHHEIISFDPRGIGESEPRVDCFHGNLLARQAMELEDRGTWGLDTGRRSLTYSLASMDAYGRRCEDADKRYGADVLRFVGTPSVARDLVEMADKVEEERRKRLANDDNLHSNPDSKGRSELKRRDIFSDPVRIQYMGFSYGTVLGHYLAAIFPHRVGRIILDGVCDVDDYATGPGWLANLDDTDELFDHFLKGCHEKGVSVCSLARSDDKKWTELRKRVFEFIDNLDTRPRVALMPDGNNIVLTGHDILKLAGMMLYKPLNNYKSFASMLDEVMRGNNTLLAETLRKGGYIPTLQEGCSASARSGGGEGDSDCPGPKPVPIPDIQGIEGLYSVLCGDGDDVSDRDVSWWMDYISQQVSTSRILGAYWSTLRFGCSGWRARANWSFKGPFTTPAAGSGPDAPAAPVLFLSNTLDPVTPLVNARTMAAKHPGAGVVVQKSMGHCALASAPSRCTSDIVAKYLELGTVPEEEVLCLEDCGPWDEDCRLDRPNDASFTENDKDILGKASEGMVSEHHQHSFPGLQLPRHPLGVL